MLRAEFSAGWSVSLGPPFGFPKDVTRLLFKPCVEFSQELLRPTRWLRCHFGTPPNPGVLGESTRSGFSDWRLEQRAYIPTRPSNTLATVGRESSGRPL